MAIVDEISGREFKKFVEQPTGIVALRAAARVGLTDPDKLLGSYSVMVPTGAIVATLAANSTLFSLRWTEVVNLAILEYIWVSGVVSGAITAAVLFDLEARIVRQFSASDSGGTVITLTGNNQKRLGIQATSLVGDARVSSTAALTAGTRTLDAQAIGRIQGFTGTTVGTKLFDAWPSPLYQRVTGDFPIVFGQNEGLLIRNPLVGPATGTITLQVGVGWSEVSAF